VNSPDSLTDAGVLEQCFYWIEAHMKGTSYTTCIFSASNTSTIGVCESSLRHNLIKFLGGMLDIKYFRHLQVGCATLVYIPTYF
jgi:hypothetical protein